MFHKELADIIFKIVLTILLTSLIGIERSARQKVAGLRTHILVGVSSALIVLTSFHVFDIYKTETPLDPTRMIAAIITGIGFLCAGTIIRGGEGVRGLTTAATLWISACLGIAVGAGHYLAAILVTLVVYCVLTVFKSLESKV